jgi:CheY-like chemotaxis protein
MMGRGTSRRSAVVADRRPLERGLARFLLEERGLSVVGEAATMADVLLQVQQLKPDIVVLHEKLALDHDPTVIAQIRRTSPRTSIVLLAANRESLPPELILLADTVVEDGPGLTELGVALGGPPPAKDATTDVEATGVLASAVASPKRRPGSRWADRLQGLAVASIIALAFVVARDMTTPSLVPTVVGRAHMVRAWDSLDELESALPIATTEQIAEIASVLIDERAAAEAGGVDLTSFDQALRERLASLWPRLPLETQALLVGLFQELIDDSDVLPLPSPSPSPNPSPESPPPPSETTPPPPTETTPPPPSETTTPPPTETTTPPPSETTPPPPSETQSESLVLIPFAFTLMLAISGWARRRSHRSADGPD